MVATEVSTLKPKLMFVVNLDSFFWSHRLPIALAALQNDFEVHIATSLTDTVDKMRALGLVVHPLSIERSSAGMVSNGRSFFQMLSLFRQVRPDLVHLVTIKPVLMGGFAARLSGVPSVVAAISGLGFVFTARGVRAKFRRLLVEWLYRLALGHSTLKVIFQNEDDRSILLGLRRLATEKTMLIRGSGVDLDAYSATPIPQGVPVVILAARLLGDKGVREFVQAARLLKSQNSDARFVLVGSPDPGNPTSVTESELEQWASEGVVEYWGYRNDMAHVFTLSHIVVLPSYREGVPKVLIEAAACSRPIVTTNAPGCRDAIEPEKTGLLVPVRDVTALAEAINKLLADPDLCRQMGRAGRELAERVFDIKQVVAQHMQVYDELLQRA